MTERCYECGAEEYAQHKLSCDSKAVFNAYITLRDNDLNYFTEEMISTLGFKLFMENCERFQMRSEMDNKKITVADILESMTVDQLTLCIACGRNKKLLGVAEVYKSYVVRKQAMKELTELSEELGLYEVKNAN